MLSICYILCTCREIVCTEEEGDHQPLLKAELKLVKILRNASKYFFYNFYSFYGIHTIFNFLLKTIQQSQSKLSSLQNSRSYLQHGEGYISVT